MRRPSSGRVRAGGVAAALLVVGLAGSGCGLSLQSLPKATTSLGPSYALHAQFANVLNLPEDAQVRLGAEVIGQVTAIKTANFEADITFDVKKSVKLPIGTTAQVRFDNPLGDEYIILATPPAASAGDLRPDALIPAADTSTAPSVEDTFGALSLVLNGGGLNQLQVIIHELNDTFNGNQPQIRSFLTTIDKGVATVTGGRVVIDNALAAIGNLTMKLNAGRSIIANGIDTLGPAIGVLASENSQFSRLLSELSDLGTIGTKVADESGQNSVTDAQDLLPVVEQLQSVSTQLGPDLADLSKFEADTPKVAPGDYLQVKVLVNVLLPAGGFEPSPVAGPDSGGASTTAVSTAAPSDGTGAVSSLLQAGLG